MLQVILIAMYQKICFLFFFFKEICQPDGRKDLPRCLNLRMPSSGSCDILLTQWMPVTEVNQIDSTMKGTIWVLWAQGFVGSRIIWTLVLHLLWSVFWIRGLLFSLTSVMNLQPFVFLAFIKVIPNCAYYKCWNYLFSHFLNEMM